MFIPLDPQQSFLRGCHLGSVLVGLLGDGQKITKPHLYKRTSLSQSAGNPFPLSDVLLSSLSLPLPLSLSPPSLPFSFSSSLHYCMPFYFPTLRCFSPSLFQLHSTQKQLRRMALSILIFILPICLFFSFYQRFPHTPMSSCLYHYCNSLQINPPDLYCLYYDPDHHQQVTAMLTKLQWPSLLQGFGTQSLSSIANFIIIAFSHVFIWPNLSVFPV